MMLLLALSACAAGPDGGDVIATDTSGYIANPEQRLAAIDWAKAETANITLSEYAFTPSSLRFEENRPYRLHLTNVGSSIHNFTAKPFFQAIAAARLVESGKTLPLPRLEAIGLGPGESKDLYFVAVRAGQYDFECTRPLHAMFGMTGTVSIE